MSDRDALITGIGLVSSLGEGPDAHWAALNAVPFAPVLDSASYPPFTLHPLARVEFDRQIPKRGDQRQMELWQRIGTYAAGLALEQAGVKGDKDLLDRTHMIVAAGGGERDVAVDEAVLSGIGGQAQPDTWLNERLMSDLRPTLFLAQLSNLMAGNISIVHGVVGSSRTFMGEEAGGVDAVRVACARLQAGQGDLFLVGGAYNAERPDVHMHMALGGALRTKPWAPLRARMEDGGGAALGSLGCFLVIESRAHAAARSATPLARIAGIEAGRCRRNPGEATANAQRQWDALAPAADAAVVTAASGAGATAEELAWLDTLNRPVRAATTAFGHSLEAAFPAALAVATISVARGQLFAPLEAAEPPSAGRLTQAVVNCWGHWRGEGMALVAAA